MGAQVNSYSCVGIRIARNMPVVLPHELFPWMMRSGIWPNLEEKQIQQYWQHLKDVGSPLSALSDDASHIPVYLWGDGAQYTESGESMSVFCCGIVVDDNRSNIFPLFLCREETRSFVKNHFVFCLDKPSYQALDWFSTYFEICGTVRQLRI